MDHPIFPAFPAVIRRRSSCPPTHLSVPDSLPVTRRGLTSHTLSILSVSPVTRRRTSNTPSHLNCTFQVLRTQWFFPIIGHMGICTSTGIIRDFAGPYFVSEDNMAFGKPAKYWKLDPNKVYVSGPSAWDTAVHDASEEYKHHMHNLCCDNCHSHVALALNLMRYDNSARWNMVKLCLYCLLYGKYVSLGALVKTWLPFLLFLGVVLTVTLTLHLR